MDFITSNWGMILAAIPMIIGIATIITKATPNKTDDKVVAFLMKLVDLIAIHAETTKFVPKKK
jgi:hypothetical protein